MVQLSKRVCTNYKKAEVNQINEILAEILQEKSPYKCKTIARQLPNTMEWKRTQEDVMLKGCTAKFEQNANLQEFLLKTDNRTIVEARLDDKFLGAGLRHDSHQIGSNKWPGKKQILGKILMSIRDTLKPNMPQ